MESVGTPGVASNSVEKPDLEIMDKILFDLLPFTSSKIHRYKETKLIFCTTLTAINSLINYTQNREII